MADQKPESTRDPNLQTYNSPPVTEHYAALDYVTPCEQMLFDEYLRRGMAVLDLGVGGGRLAPYLSSLAGSYVGVDYAPEMIAACRRRFPNLRFEVASAADLSIFGAATFDAVVMAFNAIDYVLPDEKRTQALEEIRRVLKAGGILIFSSHNPRAIFVRPAWSAKRVEKLAESVVKPDSMFFVPAMRILTAARAGLAILQAALQSVGRIVRRLPSAAFWRGEGSWLDPVHGGLLTHGATPEMVIREADRFGFQLLRLQGDDYPLTSRLYVTDWYYYVFSSLTARGEK